MMFIWVLVAISAVMLGLGILGVLYLVVQLNGQIARIARAGSELERTVTTSMGQPQPV